MRLNKREENKWEYFFNKPRQTKDETLLHINVTVPVLCFVVFFHLIDEWKTKQLIEMISSRPDGVLIVKGEGVTVLLTSSQEHHWPIPVDLVNQEHKN